MRNPVLIASLALILLAAGSTAQIVAPQPSDNTFEFHSGFWVNLHHFLYGQATAESTSSPSPPEWLRAVEWYRREAVKPDVLSDEAAQINDRLSELETASSLRDSGLPPEMISVLEAATPVYRAR